MLIVFWSSRWFVETSVSASSSQRCVLGCL